MNPLQRAAFRRKAYYFAAILALFTLSMFWRGTIPIPLSGSAQASTGLHRTANRMAAQTILGQSQRLELRELEQGDPEPVGEAVRLLLTGSRGVAVTLLWYDAIEHQKRNDFHKFEQSVKAVTTLQPHFITPWIFQSWNIAYNVSVEMHSLGDMYFYIARGIELLAEGERRNNRSPDMRYQIAFYYQNKFGVSDQVQTLRCLFQLSCIPPNEREPDSLLDKDKVVDLVAFKTFCEKNPLLVRRLRGQERIEKGATDKNKEKLQNKTPAEIVDFLRANFRVPSRYKNSTDLAPRDQQFPIFPEKFPEGVEEVQPTATAQDLGPAFSGYLAARAWFTYANAIVPPNPTDENRRPIPSGVPKPGDYDQFLYRMPRAPMLILFRQGPPRAQTYQAELMQKDGWFDSDGWEVDADIDDAEAWFASPGAGGRREKWKTPVVIGKGTEWCRSAWEKAAGMWRYHGDAYGLILPENRREQLRAEAGIPPGASDQVRPPTDPYPEQMEDPTFARVFRATSALFYYHQNRTVTNFPYYLASAEAEQKGDTIVTRKTLWRADQARRNTRNDEAIKLYEDGLTRWKDVLIKNPAFHRSDRFDKAEEETYEYELDFLRLIALNDPRVRDRARKDYIEEYTKLVSPVRAVIPGFEAMAIPTEIPQAVRPDWNALTAEKHFAKFNGLITDKDTQDNRVGTPWIGATIREAVHQRQGVQVRKPGVEPVPTAITNDAKTP